jgi:hypothetical protein
MENLKNLRTLIVKTGYSYELKNGSKNYKLMPESSFPVFFEGCFLSNYMGAIEINYSGLKADKEGFLQPFCYNFPANTFYLDKLIKAFSGNISLFGKYQENNLTAPNLTEVKELGILYESDIKLLKMASKIVKKDDLRPILECVYFDSQNIVATDGHVLFSRPCKKEFNILIPIPAQKWIVKQKCVTIFENDNTFILESENSKFEFRREPENFPDYRRVLPKNELRIRINKVDLINAISQAEIMANQASNLLKIEIAQNSIIVSSQDFDYSLYSSVYLPIENLSNVSGCIGFKSSLLLTVLTLDKVKGNDMLEINLKDEFSGCYFDDILVMPMNLKDNDKPIKSVETDTDEKKHASEKSDTDEKICTEIAIGPNFQSRVGLNFRKMLSA